MVRVLLPKLVPDRSELLAMSTPRGIELNQHILLRHQVLLQLSSKELGDKGLDVLCLNLVVVRLELGHVLAQLDGPEGGQFGLSDTEELKDPLMVVLVSVDGNEQHLTLVLLGNALEHGHIVSVRVGFGAKEGKEVRLDVTRK